MSHAGHNPVLHFDQIEPGFETDPKEIRITLEMIANYCASIGEDDPIYLDDAAAKALGLPGVVCPASMHLVYAPMRRLDIMHQRGFISPEEDPVHPRATPFVGTEIEWKGTLVRPGDVITSTARFARKWEARSGNRFVGIAITAQNQRGESVVDYQYNILWEFAKGQKARVAMDGPATPPVETDAEATGARVLRRGTTFEGIEPGDALPTASRHVTQETINDYTRLNDWEGRGPNPTMLLHVDEEFAASTVFSGTTLHGPAGVGHLVALLARGFDIRAIIGGSTFSQRALEPVRPGDTVTYTGQVVGKRDGKSKSLVGVELKGTNQLGQTTASATAVVQL